MSALSGKDHSAFRPLAAAVQVTPPNSSASGLKTSIQSQSVNAAAAVSLQVSSPDLFTSTGLAAQPQAVMVTLNYSPACAGAQVQVAPLDGGSINGTSGGTTLTVAADGTLVFTFQAPANPGRYHVVTQLGNVQMSMPFDVAAPTPAAAAGN